MDQALQQELLNIVKDSKMFVLEQAPDVFQQILSYGFWSNVIGVCVSLAFAFAAIFLLKAAKREGAKDFYQQNGAISVGAPIVGGIVLLVSIIFTVDCIDTLIAIKVAPKYFLIHKLSKKSCS